MTIDQPADQGIEQDNKGGPKCGDKEERLLPVLQAISKISTKITIAVEQEQCGQTERGIKFGVIEVLESVDDHSVGGSSCIKARDSHQSRHLANCDVDRRACHEGRYCGQRDKIHNPATASEPNEANYCSSDDSKS